MTKMRFVGEKMITVLNCIRNGHNSFKDLKNLLKSTVKETATIILQLKSAGFIESAGFGGRGELFRLTNEGKEIVAEYFHTDTDLIIDHTDLYLEKMGYQCCKCSEPANLILKDSCSYICAKCLLWICFRKLKESGARGIFYNVIDFANIWNSYFPDNIEKQKNVLLAWCNYFSYQKKESPENPMSWRLFKRIFKRFGVGDIAEKEFKRTDALELRFYWDLIQHCRSHLKNWKFFFPFVRQLDYFYYQRWSHELKD